MIQQITTNAWYKLGFRQRCANWFTCTHMPPTTQYWDDKTMMQSITLDQWHAEIAATGFTPFYLKNAWAIDKTFKWIPLIRCRRAHLMTIHGDVKILNSHSPIQAPTAAIRSGLTRVPKIVENDFCKAYIDISMYMSRFALSHDWSRYIRGFWPDMCISWPSKAHIDEAFTNHMSPIKPCSPLIRIELKWPDPKPIG